MNPDAPEMQVSGDREGVEFVNISTSNSSFEKINTGRRLENSTGRPGGSVSGGGAGFPRPAAGSAEPSRSHGLAASWVGAGWGVGRPIASRFSTGRCCHLRSSSTGGRQARVRAVRGSSASGRQMDTAARVVSNLTKLQKVR